MYNTQCEGQRHRMSSTFRLVPAQPRFNDAIRAATVLDFPLKKKGVICGIKEVRQPLLCSPQSQFTGKSATLQKKKNPVDGEDGETEEKQQTDGHQFDGKVPLGGSIYGSFAHLRGFKTFFMVGQAAGTGLQVRVRVREFGNTGNKELVIGRGGGWGES